MLGRNKKEAKIGMDNSFIGVAASTPNKDGHIDMSAMEMVSAVMPSVGIIVAKDGTLVPQVFVEVEYQTNDGKKGSHTLSFHPMGLASACNLMSSIALLVISDPESAAKEVAQAAGVQAPSKPSYGQYL